MPSRVALAALTAPLAAAVVTLAAASASAQSMPYEAVEAPTTWKVDIGGGVVRGFSATGNTSDDFNFTAWGSASWRDVVYANGLDGLYAYKRLPGNIVVGGRIQHDVSGDDAGLEYYGSVGHQRVTRVGLLQTMGYVRGGDDERARRYYGVTAAEAPGSGYAVFEPSGGLSGLGGVIMLAVPIGDRFGMGGFINYEQRLGDLKDSPLVEDDHVWRAGLIGVVRFNSGQ